MTIVAKCVNCSNEAVYTYLITDSYSKSYCANDLPKFLKSREYSDRVVEALKISSPVEVEASKSSKKKTSTPPVVVEEVEEPEVVLEETEEDAPEVPEDKQCLQYVNLRFKVTKYPNQHIEHMDHFRQKFLNKILYSMNTNTRTPYTKHQMMFVCSVVGTAEISCTKKNLILTTVRMKKKNKTPQCTGIQLQRKINIMAVNENGNLLDTAGNVAVDFVWGNIPMQPNDEREENGQTVLLNPALDNHSIAYEGWNGYPLYNPGVAGAEGAGYIVVPSVIGQTTANATDILEDDGLVVTVGTAATNAASTITAVSRTGTTATITSTGAGAKYPVGTKITVATLASPDTALNGTWTVTAVATNTVSFTTTTSGALSTAELTVAGLTGVAGTVKTQSVAAGANTIAVGAAITIVAFAAAS